MREPEQQSAFYVIERTDGTRLLYMADRSCGWATDIDLAARWEERFAAEGVWRRLPCHLRGMTGVREYGVLRDR